jgi:GntR family phosphonate transport system transcriptional regulator
MTDLRRRSGAALWQQIEEVLADEIVGGEHRHDHRLPTEPELMERFGVSRATVRRAMSQLEARGLVRVEQGRGTFVHNDGVIDYRLSERTRFSQSLIEQGREPSALTLRDDKMPATDVVAQALRLPPGEPVHRIVRLSSVDDVPVSVGDAYYPCRRFPDMPKRRRTRSDVTSIYAEYGIADYIRLQTFITTRMPTSEEARTLCQPRSFPVIVVRKIDTDMSGVPIAYAETVWAGARVQFSIDNSGQLLRRRDA